jgi:hypothetical protein
MKTVTLIVLAVAGGACGWVVASIVLTFRRIGDFQDVWDDDDDVV